MTALFAALAALTLVPGTDADVVERARVRFAGTALVGPSCTEVMAGTAEPGVASFHFQYQVTGGHRLPSGRYTGKIAFALTDVLITMPKSISWLHMTSRDREHAEALRRAIYHHEVGHVRIAEAVRDELNAHEAVVAPDPFAFGAAADALGREGFERFKREERDYDALTDHGREQHLAPGVLAGPDTALVCAAR
jgi:predicted secreted Zn-dependent protease